MNDYLQEKKQHKYVIMPTGKTTNGKKLEIGKETG